jgi:hypothetical protein
LPEASKASGGNHIWRDIVRNVSGNLIEQILGGAMSYGLIMDRFLPSAECTFLGGVQEKF